MTNNNNAKKTVRLARNWYSVEPATGEIIPAQKFVGGKADSVGSKTPSLKRPNSDYNIILKIMRDKGAFGDNGITAKEIAGEFNKIRAKKTTNAIDTKIGRLAAKKVITGKPSANNAAVTLYSIPISVFASSEANDPFDLGQVEGEHNEMA